MNSRLFLLAVFVLFVAAYLSLQALTIDANARTDRKTTIELKRKLDDALRKIAAQDLIIEAMENNIETYRQEVFYHLNIAKTMTTQNGGGLKAISTQPTKSAPSPAGPIQNTSATKTRIFTTPQRQ